VLLNGSALQCCYCKLQMGLLQRSKYYNWGFEPHGSDVSNLIAKFALKTSDAQLYLWKHDTGTGKLLGDAEIQRKEHYSHAAGVTRDVTTDVWKSAAVAVHDAGSHANLEFQLLAILRWEWSHNFWSNASSKEFVSKLRSFSVRLWATKAGDLKTSSCKPRPCDPFESFIPRAKAFYPRWISPSSFQRSNRRWFYIISKATQWWWWCPSLLGE